MNKKLYKISTEKKVAGVCAGLAEYLNADVTIIRIIVTLLILSSFSTLLILYIICAIVMPDKSELY
ncbi:PspC domain-containing protein [Clostridium sp.]|uniref:PspC domain-containing protein n=1 Tax=Clostridium sp. TaxID=1506 RepID=UPI002631F6AB|nr:PspC domain-containing protein [Clostridium sp.]